MHHDYSQPLTCYSYAPFTPHTMCLTRTCAGRCVVRAWCVVRGASCNGCITWCVVWLWYMVIDRQSRDLHTQSGNLLHTGTCNAPSHDKYYWNRLHITLSFLSLFFFFLLCPPPPTISDYVLRSKAFYLSNIKQSPNKRLKRMYFRK
jgi:hypothetical protein